MRNKKEYLDSACEQIRFKAARKYLRQELEAHIDDKMDAFETEGVQNAEAEAAHAMGDAVETGRALDAIHSPRIGWGVIACVLLLSIAGILALALANDRYFSFYTIYQNQLGGVAVGLCVMLCMMFFDYTWLLQLRHVLYSGAILLNVIHRLVSDSLINGVYYPGSSLSVFIETMIPALFLLGVTGYLQMNKGKGIFGLVKNILLYMISYILPLILFSNVSFRTHQIILLILICIAISRGHYTAKQRGLQYLIVFGSIAAAVLISFLIVSPDVSFTHMLSRFEVGINNGGNYTSYVRAMLQSAKLTGPSDYWLSHQTQSIPFCHTSHILTCIIGIYGWLAGIGIIAGFCALFSMLFIRIKRIAHPFGRMLAAAVFLHLLFRCVITFMMSLGFIMGPDLNIPFISYGRIDYIVNAAMIGIFLSVWRRSSFMHQGICDTASGIFVRRLKA